jgi:hypothetical protein
VLDHAHAVHAKEIIILTPEGETNLRIAVQVRELTVPDGSVRPACSVYLKKIELLERLQQVVRAARIAGPRKKPDPRQSNFHPQTQVLSGNGLNPGSVAGWCLIFSRRNAVLRSEISATTVRPIWNHAIKTCPPAGGRTAPSSHALTLRQG